MADLITGLENESWIVFQDADQGETRALLRRFDRHSVIFSSNQDDVDRRHLWRVDLQGGKPQALTKGETMEWSPLESGTGGQVEKVCYQKRAEGKGNHAHSWTKP